MYVAALLLTQGFADVEAIGWGKADHPEVSLIPLNQGLHPIGMAICESYPEVDYFESEPVLSATYPVYLRICACEALSIVAGGINPDP